MTLVDLSAEMLAVSRALNPECRHVRGDMRTVRLGHAFDAVFIHDAIDYMVSEGDLQAALETAYAHCRPGGVALLVPDHVREDFKPSVHHGGHDGGGQGLRYLEWSFDPDPADTQYTVDYSYLLRERDGATRLEHDRHVLGLFPQETWLGLLRDVGFQPEVVLDPYQRRVFLAAKPS